MPSSTTRHQMIQSAGISPIRGTRTSLPLCRSGASLPTVVVEVIDNGSGITAEARKQLSTPFFTTRAGGTGLGLAVSKHWVARHGGSLRIYSTLGEGTRVRVNLPLRTPS